MKALYDRITGTALRVVLFVAGVGVALRLLVRTLGGAIGWDVDGWFVGAGFTVGVEDAWLRLLFYGTAQLAIAWYLVPHLLVAERALADGWRRTRKRLVRGRRLSERGRQVKRWLERGWRAVVALVLAALVLQPTLVPLDAWGGSAWVARAANLLDGTATARWPDSVVGVGHQIAAEPVVPAGPVAEEDLLADLDDEVVPLIDRWDAQLLEAAQGDAELAAMTKAIMWVESGGRQYALSSTGCAGLMQFCASRAQRRPFHRIFGVGQVSPCGCTPCAIPREVQNALETDATAVERVQADVPCSLADARFDGDKSVRAGVAFVRELADQVHGNLALMYVGYNAGPRVATDVYAALGEPGVVTSADLEPHLRQALRRYHGAQAERMASGLLEVHLPKLEQAYAKWAPQVDDPR